MLYLNLYFFKHCTLFYRIQRLLKLCLWCMHFVTLTLSHRLSVASLHFQYSSSVTLSKCLNNANTEWTPSVTPFLQTCHPLQRYMLEFPHGRWVIQGKTYHTWSERPHAKRIEMQNSVIWSHDTINTRDTCYDAEPEYHLLPSNPCIILFLSQHAQRAGLWYFLAKTSLMLHYPWPTDLICSWFA